MGELKQGRPLWRVTRLGALAVLLILAGSLAALHLPPVQRAIFDRAVVAVEGRTGLRVGAEAVRLRPLGIRLELTSPSVAAGGAAPFLIADSLIVELAPRGLVRRPLTLHRVVLAAPTLDVSGPMPDLPEAEREPAGPLPVAIEEIQIRDGAVRGFDLPAEVRPFLGEASVEGVQVDGSLRDAGLDLGWRIDRVAARPEDLPPLVAGLQGRVTGPIEGPLRLESLALEGDAVSVSARGAVGFGPDQPLALEFELAAEAPRLLGVEAAGKPVRLDGEVDLRRMAGKLRLEAPEVPGELAGRWLAAEVAEAAGLAGSRMAVSGSASFGQGTFEGVAEARWTRGPEVLAAVSLASEGELAAAETTVVAELELLPAAAGERRAEARLLMPRADLAGTRVEGGRLRLDLPDLETEARRLRRLWPAWVPELPPGLARGPFRARGRFGGPLTDLVARLEGDWAPVAGSAVRLAANGSVGSRQLDARLNVEGFPAARFGQGIQGAIDASAELSLTGNRVAAELSLSADGLGWEGASMDRASFEAELDGLSLRVRELAISSAGRHLRAAGEVDLSGVPVADLELHLTADGGPVSAAEGRLRLVDGSLLLEVPRADLGGVAASLSAKAPLATLAQLPGAEALAGLAPAGSAGPLEIEWSQPAIDWAEAIGPSDAEEADRDAVSRWVAGSIGRLALDPSSPTNVSGEVVLSDLVLEQAGRLVRGPAALRMVLGGGRIELAPATLEVDGHPVELAGTARLLPEWRPGVAPEELIQEARVTARTRGAEPVEDADLELTLRGGRIELDVTARMADGGHGRLAASGPLSALGAGGGTLEASWHLPIADWSGWLPAPADEAQTVTRLVAGTAGLLRMDPSRPTLGSGELRVEGFEVEVGDQSLRAREPIALRLAEGRLDIESARLLASGAPLELSGWVQLDSGWRPGSPMSEVMSEVMVSGGGDLPAALLNPFMAGGAGEGALLAEVEVAGPRESVRGVLRLTGSGAGFYFASPYALELAEPEATVRVEAGGATFEGSVRLNEGRLTFSGGADAQAGIDLEARLSEVRAVLDYGLLTLLDGSLRLTLAPDGEGLLAGTLTVDRGQLTRSIRLDSLLLDQLLPADLLGTELDPLEGVGLDLTLTTRQGVRVKNNLADLKVRWQPISVRGNLVRPIIEGRLEVDPGGLVHAYGQTVRLDSAAVVYRGLPEEVPELELQTTTSLEDPSIGRLAGDDPFAERRAARDADAEEGEGGAAESALTTGLASFLGERFNSSVGEVLGGTRISFRPPLIFGEADPGARLTAASDLSARATVAASVDLRNAERQTYLLDLHDEDATARLSAQLFTNDLGNEGGTLQQRLEFGGGGRRQDGPRVRRLRIDSVPGVRRRALKRAVGHRKGDRLAEGGTFEAAVAVGELLRDRGYPDARVRVRQEAAAGRSGVVLEVGIDSGPRVEFRFTGASLPKSLRRAVAQLYRGDFYEPTAIEEMRLEAGGRRNGGG